MLGRVNFLSRCLNPNLNEAEGTKEGMLRGLGRKHSKRFNSYIDCLKI